MLSIPGVDMNMLTDKGPLHAAYNYYTINVNLLHTMTHDEFCAEFPVAAREIARANAILDKLDQLLGASPSGS